MGPRRAPDRTPRLNRQNASPDAAHRILRCEDSSEESSQRETRPLWARRAGGGDNSASMIEYGGHTYPTISAYLLYEDVGAALDFLAHAFDFTERMRNLNPDGSLSHCEMAYGDSVIMLGNPPNYRGPAKLGAITV